MIYEDAHIICVDKPPGMLSVPGLSCSISSSVGEVEHGTEAQSTHRGKKRKIDSSSSSNANTSTADNGFVKRDEQWAKAIIEAAAKSNSNSNNAIDILLSRLASKLSKSIGIPRKKKQFFNYMQKQRAFKDIEIVDDMLSGIWSRITGTYPALLLSYYNTNYPITHYNTL